MTTYDQLFIEYGNAKYRLSEIIIIWTIEEKSAVCFALRGWNSDVEYVRVPWDVGGEMLWEMFSDVTAVLRKGDQDEP